MLVSDILGDLAAIITDGVPFSTSTSPTQAVMIKLVDLAQRSIARNIPSHLLSGLHAEFNPSLAAVSLVAKPNDWLYPVSGTLNISGSDTDVPLMFVGSRAASRRHIDSLFGTEFWPIAWEDASNLNFSPATTGTAATGKLVISYVKSPDALTLTTDELEIDNKFRDLVVYWVAATYFNSQDDIERANGYLAMMKNLIIGEQ